MSFVRGWLGIGFWGSGVYSIMSLGVQCKARQSFSIWESLSALNLLLIMRVAVCLLKPAFNKNACLFFIPRCAKSF